MDIGPQLAGRRTAILRHFESLGYNCEFGLVQRHYGIETLGLLRWGHVQRGFGALLRAIDERFARIGEDMSIEQTPHEVVSRDNTYEIVFHIPVGSGPTDHGRLIATERQRVMFLAEALIDSFGDPEAILVYKAEEDLSVADLLRLRRSIDRYGSAPLLWVVDGAPAERAGEVEAIAPGLFRAGIDRFSPRENIFAHCSFDLWLQVAERTAELVDHLRRPGGDERPSTRPRMLRSSHGGLLARDAASGAVVHASGFPIAGATPLTLLGLAAHPEIGFLVAGGALPSPLALGPWSEPAAVLAVRVERGDHRLALRHPITGRLLCATPIGPDGRGGVVADRTERSEWEEFEPLEVPFGLAVPDSVQQALSRLGPLLDARLAERPTLDWFREAADEELGLLGPAILSLAPPDTLAALAAALRTDPARAGRLGDLADPFTKAVLSFRPGESPPTRIEVGSEADPLATVVTPGETQGRVATALFASVRRQVAPTRGVCLVATARNEGPYLVDWLAHHRALGVEHVFLYSNDNDDGSDALLDALSREGAITWLPNRSGPGVDGQRKSYNHAFHAVPALLDFRWTAMIDLDEFLVLDEVASASTLPALLATLERDGAEEVVANWHMFTPSGLIVFEDRPVAERFLGRAPGLNPHVKTIVRTNRAVGATSHVPIWPGRTGRVTVDSNGHPYGFPEQFVGPHSWQTPQAAPLSIHHYHLKSLPEYAWKVSRNDGAQPARAELRFSGRFFETFLDEFALADAVEDRGALARADRIGAERAALLALPGVRAARDAVLDTFRRRVRSLVEDLADPSVLPGTPEQRSRFAGLAAESVARGVCLA